MFSKGGGGGALGKNNGGVCPKKGRSWVRAQPEKRGLLGAGRVPKGGSLVRVQPEKGGLRCGHSP